MKKVEVETVCGEVSTIYVSQDVEKITVDGETYKPDEKKIPTRGKILKDGGGFSVLWVERSFGGYIQPDDDGFYDIFTDDGTLIGSLWEKALKNPVTLKP